MGLSFFTLAGPAEPRAVWTARLFLIRNLGTEQDGIATFPAEKCGLRPTFKGIASTARNIGR
jgi:hypothetical protein